MSQPAPDWVKNQANFGAFTAIFFMLLAFQAFGKSTDLTHVSYVGLLSSVFMFASTIVLIACFAKFRFSLGFNFQVTLITLVVALGVVRAPFTPLGHMSFFKDLFLLCMAVNGLFLVGLAARYRLDLDRLLIYAGSALLVVSFFWALLHYQLPLSVAETPFYDIDSMSAMSTASPIFLKNRFTVFETHPLLASDIVLLLALLAIIDKGKHLFIIIIFLLCAYAFASRTSLIAFVICVLLFLVPLSTNVYRTIIVVFLGLVMAIFWIWPLLYFALPDYLSTYILYLDNLNGRMPLWEGTLQHIFHNGTVWDIVLGFGREAGRELLPRYGVNFSPVHAHHVFYHTLFARGILGLAVLVVLLGWIAFKNTSNRPRLIILLFIVLSSVNNPKIFEGTFFDLIIILFAAIGRNLPTGSTIDSSVGSKKHKSAWFAGDPVRRGRGAFALR